MDVTADRPDTGWEVFSMCYNTGPSRFISQQRCHLGRYITLCICCSFVSCRSELSAAVPWPSTELLTYHAVPATGVTHDSLTWLNWMKERLLRPAKRYTALGFEVLGWA